MLRRLIGEDIDLRTNLASNLANVIIDAGQLQQVIMNLTVNSRDAMPGGGVLLIETQNSMFDEASVAAHPGVRQGPHVMLAVTDTGTGMTDEVKDRMFEPFFTTKPQGAGTGLGLASVYGMVKQAGGWIWVYSEPGHGTSFKCYFPVCHQPLSHTRPVPKTNILGTETILVVEDQPEVRRLAVAALQKYGYTVYAACSGDEALSLLHEMSVTVDLLVTDVVMPGMNGLTLAQKLSESRPELRVLFMSGYTDDAIAHYGVLLEPGGPYLQKPFTPESLGERVRQVLGPRQASATVLVVDDEDGVRRFISHLLTRAGYAVLEAANGRQAMEQLGNGGQVDLVITDLVMPEQEGLETIRHIHARHAGVKVLAISGAFGGDFLTHAARMGAVATLRKPLESEALLEAVRELLHT
jgi:CheY-like chemotaxis protein